MHQNLKDNITSPLLSSLSSSSTTTIFSLMQSILFQLKDHFTSSSQTNPTFLNDLFTLLHHLTTSYNQLTLSIKSKQAYIKSTNIVINTLKDTITSFIASHSHKLCNNNNNNNTSSSSSFLNISSQITFSYTHDTPLPNENVINTQDSFLNCAELSNEDIINKIKQKIEKKNSDVNVQYNTIQVNQQQGSSGATAHHVFSPLKDNINTPIKGKSHKYVNVNRIKRGNTMHEERSKCKSKCASAKRIVKKLPSHISVNLNLSIDKQQQQQQRLNNSFNVYQQRRTYSLPNGNNNNNLRTSSNKLKKQNTQHKEEPILTNITINTNTNNSVIQQDNKLNSPSIINEHNKVNSTFVCTFVRNGNTIQKYTLNTKANQNVPRASHYANYLLSKYKGVIAAYNEGQGKN